MDPLVYPAVGKRDRMVGTLTSWPENTAGALNRTGCASVSDSPRIWEADAVDLEVSQVLKLEPKHHSAGVR